MPSNIKDSQKLGEYIKEFLIENKNKNIFIYDAINLQVAHIIQTTKLKKQKVQ